MAKELVNEMIKERDLIDEIMDNFDFEKVHRVMTAVEWTWATIGGVPEVRDLRTTARKLLKGAFVSGLYGTGGLYATYQNDVLRLSFNVDSWSAYEGIDGKVYSDV